MNTTLITITGIAAAIITTSSWLPQVWRTIRSRSTKDFSWGYLAMFCIGTSLWLAYGILREDPAIIAANGITLALVMVIAAIKMSSRRDTRSAR
jgi:MtN3 and saliva related transmembrane protein